MAADSGTSFGYVHSGVTWKNSTIADKGTGDNSNRTYDPYDEYGDIYGMPFDSSSTYIACICLGEGT